MKKLLSGPSFDRYLVLVIRRSGLYHIEEVEDNPARKFYTHEGHRYEWNPGHAHRLIGWFPWQAPTMNPLLYLYHWIQRRMTSVGVLLYAELPDPPDETLLVSPLTHSNHVTKGYTRVNPVLLKGAILSPLYRRYEKARWGSMGTSTKTLLIVFGAFAIIIVILWQMGWFD